MKKDIERVLLITRLSTQNAGNEALSIEFIRLIRSLLPDADVRAIDRYPIFFKRFSIASFGDSRDTIIARFDAACSKLLERFGNSSGIVAPIASEELVRLDTTARELPGWITRTKRRIAARRRLAALGIIGSADAGNTVLACRWPDLLMWNPAGEIHPPGKFSRHSSDEVVRLLMLVRLAQLSGVRTMIVNHSLEIGDARLREILAHVYVHAERVTVRDCRSLQAAVHIGVSPARASEIPDMVFLGAADPTVIVPPAHERFAQGTICLAINGRQAESMLPEWDRLLAGLRSLGRPLGFLTNAMHHDVPVFKALATKHGVKMIDRQPTYREIRGFFAEVALLIGSRLHSNIIALTQGIPVVSLEASVFKMTAAFEQLHYPIGTTQMKTPGWEARVLAAANEALGERHAEFAAYSRAIALEQALHIRTGYSALVRNGA